MTLKWMSGVILLVSPSQKQKLVGFFTFKHWSTCGANSEAGQRTSGPESSCRLQQGPAQMSRNAGSRRTSPKSNLQGGDGWPWHRLSKQLPGWVQEMDLRTQRRNNMTNLQKREAIKIHVNVCFHTVRQREKLSGVGGSFWLQVPLCPRHYPKSLLSELIFPFGTSDVINSKCDVILFIFCSIFSQINLFVLFFSNLLKGCLIINSLF